MPHKEMANEVKLHTSHDGFGSSFGSDSRDSNKPKEKKPKKKKVLYIELTSSSSSEGSSESSEEEDSSESFPSSEENNEPCSKRMKESFRKKPDKSRKVKQPDSEEEFFVEKIVDMREQEGDRFFLVKWLNYASEENSWEPEKNMHGSKDLIAEYMSKISKNKSSVLETVKAKNPYTRPKPKSSPKIGMVSEISPSTNQHQQKRKKNCAARDREKINIAMERSVRKFDQNPIATLPTTATSFTEPYIVSMSETEYSRFTRPSHLFYIRVVNKNGALDLVYIDATEPLLSSNADEHFKCVLTEDLEEKQPKLIYGACKSVDGSVYCLVQFEGYTFVEVVAPSIFLTRFPSCRKFFQLHCPSLFPSSDNSH